MALRIKKGDVVIVLSGDDKGKTGKIKEIVAGGTRVIVEGVNMCKKHQKLQKQGGESGIVEKEQAVNASNLALYDGKTNKATRVRMGLSKDGKKVRVAVKSGTVFDS
ncbi:MAG: 50S ribosomal protein L24 [Deltaproteobacteria bacterium]|nr:50S ribosomal protein L24 [Deltaproteobacteria bacterium]